MRIPNKSSTCFLSSHPALGLLRAPATAALPLLLLFLAISSLISCNKELKSAEQAAKMQTNGNDASIVSDAIAKKEKTVSALLFSTSEDIARARAEIAKHGAMIETEDLRLGYFVVHIAPKKLLALSKSIAWRDVLADQTYEAADDGKPHLGKKNPESNKATRSFASQFSLDGQGIKIAVIDSGIDPGHPIFTGNGRSTISACRDFSGEGDVPLQAISASSKSGTTVRSGKQTLLLPQNLLPSTATYAGIFKESLLAYKNGTQSLRDLNGDGDSDDTFSLLAYQHKNQWQVILDTNNNDDFGDDQAVGLYSQTKQLVNFGAAMATVEIEARTAENALPSERTRPLLSLCFDGNGHGTHVAGIITQLAPRVEIYALKVQRSNGVYSLRSLMRALSFAAENGIQIANLSFNSKKRESNDPIDRVVDRLVREHNIVVVAAAGNNGPGSSSVNPPGSANLAITTGGLGWFSSAFGLSDQKSPKPEVFATAEQHSAVPLWYAQSQELPTPYEIKVGTSMATPVTSAGLALLLQKLGHDGQQASALAIGEAVRATSTFVTSAFQQEMDLLAVYSAALALAPSAKQQGVHTTGKATIALSSRGYRETLALQAGQLTRRWFRTPQHTAALTLSLNADAGDFNAVLVSPSQHLHTSDALSPGFASFHIESPEAGHWELVTQSTKPTDLALNAGLQKLKVALTPWRSSGPSLQAIASVTKGNATNITATFSFAGFLSQRRIALGAKGYARHSFTPAATGLSYVFRVQCPQRNMDVDFSISEASGRILASTSAAGCSDSAEITVNDQDTLLFSFARHGAPKTTDLDSITLKAYAKDQDFSLAIQQQANETTPVHGLSLELSPTHALPPWSRGQHLAGALRLGNDEGVAVELDVLIPVQELLDLSVSNTSHTSSPESSETSEQDESEAED